MKTQKTIRIPYTGKMRSSISKLSIVILSLPKDLRPHGKVRFLDMTSALASASGMTNHECHLEPAERSHMYNRKRFLDRLGMTSTKRNSKYQILNTKRRRLFPYIVLAILAVGIFTFLRTPQIAEAGWFDDTYGYRIPILFENNGETITDERQVLIEIDTATLISAGKMQSDCDDTRFVYNGSLVDFTIADTGACNTSSTDFYVLLPTIGAGPNTIWLYYGNESASNGTTTLLTSEMQSWWELEESSGSRSDSFGSNTLTDNNTVGSTTGAIGDAADFISSNGEYLSITDNDELSIGDEDFTAALWVKLDTVSTGGGIDIFNKWDYLSSDREYALNYNSSGGVNDFEFAVTHDGSTQAYTRAESFGAASIDTWYFVTFWHDSTANTLNIQVNNGAIDSAGHSLGINSGSSPVNFGALPDFSRFTDGSIDNVQVWKRVLTADERASLYNNGNGLSYSSEIYSPASSPATGAEEQSPQPVAYWKFDEGFGSTTQDHTSNDNDGAITGATWQTEDKCVNGKCLLFDGSDDYVTISESSTFDRTTCDNLTISAWINPKDLDQTNYGVVSKGGVSNGYRLGIRMDKIGFTASGVVDTTGNTTLVTDEWQHISAVCDSGIVYFYLNGTADGSASVSSISSASDSLTVGATSGQTFDFNGFVDEVKIYPYARTSAQIKADFANRGGPVGASAILGAGSNAALNEGLVGYWKMDETAAGSCSSGKDSCDTSGNASDGSWGADASEAAGKFGNGVSFDGTDDYVHISTGSILHDSTEGTVAAWVFRDTLTGQDAIWSEAIGGGSVLTLLNNSSSKFVYQINQSNGTWRQPTGTTVINAGQWYHVVGTHNANAGEIKVYVDGELEATNSDWDGTFHSSPIVNSSISASSNAGDWEGDIDETRIYNRALSPTEVRQLYNWAPGPVAHYKLDENTGTATVEDSSGNNHQGTLNGSMSESDWVQGKYGSALNFDGNNDQIDVTDSDILDITGGITVESWFRSDDLGDNHGGIITKSGGYFLAASDKVYELGVLSNTLYWQIGDGTSQDQVSTAFSSYVDGEWHHVAGVWDPSGNKSIFIDGIEVSSSSATLSAIQADTHELEIGGGSTSYEWQGDLDDIRIYNYARTQKQIIQDMNGGHPAGGSPIASQVGYWDFDEQQGQTVNYRGYGENNGTLGVNSGSSTDDPTWKTNRDCVLNGCLDFDGGDLINIPDTAELRPEDGSWTATVWAKPPNSNQTTILLGKRQNGAPYEQWSLFIAGNLDANASGQQLLGYFFESGSVNRRVLSNEDVADGNWHHYTLVADKVADEVRIYFDGKLLTEADQSSVGSWPTVNNTDPLRVGEGNGSYPFTGSIDEVKIYSSALTQEEILIDYNLGAATFFGEGEGATDTGLESSAAGDPPIAEWKFDENTGTTTADTSGNGYTGTINNASWTVGPNGTGQALDFSVTSSNYVSHSAIALDGTYTVSGWSSFPLTGTDWKAFVSAGASYYAIISRFSTNELGVFNGAFYGTGFDLDDLSGWHHLTAVADGADTDFYVDGVFKGTASSVISGQSMTFIGGQGSQSWNGKIDNVKIYDYALSPAQIAYDYNGGEPTAHWDLDECTGTTAYDAGVNSLNGSIIIGSSGTNTSAGTCGSGTGTEAWNNGTSGKLGYSLDFDGTDDYIKVPYNATNNPSSEYSISLWAQVQGGSGTYRAPITSRNFVSNQSYGFNIYADSSDNWELWQGDLSSGWVARATGAAVEEDVWQHIVGTYDGTNMKIYVDGVLNDTQAASYYPNTTQYLLIGAGSSEEPINYFFNGQIDDVRIYNYPLSADQVKRLYNNDSSVYYGP